MLGRVRYLCVPLMPCYEYGPLVNRLVESRHDVDLIVKTEIF